MDQTPNLKLPFIIAGQALKHITHNEALQALDAIVHIGVLDRTLIAPPVSPAEGDCYLVAASASAEWVGYEDALAAWQNGAWTFYAPVKGWLAWVLNETILIAWDGAAWIDAGGASFNPPPLVGINATADTTNRLSLNAPASLFNHEGDDHRLKINKAVLTDTASLVYQTGFSGRVEMGTAGDDDFHMKVSPDGASWLDAIIVDKDTGAVAFPNTTSSDGGANLLINGDFQINQRAFSGGTLTAGSFGHDRWKAGGAGASYTLTAEIATLSSGTILQMVAPSFWGRANMASSILTLSVEDPSADIDVEIGAASGTITAGTGRRSVTLSTASTDTGNIAVKLTPASAEVSFKRVKLQYGSLATQWQDMGLAARQALCWSYFQRLSTFMFNVGHDPSVPRNWGVVTIPEMRVVPTVSVNSGGLLGAHSMPPQLAAGSNRTIVLQYIGAAYISGFVSIGFVTMDMDAEI